MRTYVITISHECPAARNNIPETLYRIIIRTIKYICMYFQ